MSDTQKVNNSVYTDVILSSRVRLARNIAGVPFPVRLNTLQKQKINLSIVNALSSSPFGFRAVDMSSIYPYEAVSLAERHLISPGFASNTAGKVLVLSEDERISIMLGDRDHIRIQGFADGASPMEAYRIAAETDEIIASQLKYAFDEKLGFLNQNPKDLGTGMVPSVMMHLPALSRTGEMAKFSLTAGKLGFRIRGSYGDGASSKGDIFRISNYITMGLTEETAIENLKSLSLQLATKERAAAEEFVKDITVKDRINRSAGLLKNAVLLSCDEMMELLSWVRLGSLYGVLDCDPDLISRLFVSMQPATINVLAGGKLTSSGRDEIRARTVKQIFGE